MLILSILLWCSYNAETQRQEALIQELKDQISQLSIDSMEMKFAGFNFRIKKDKVYRAICLDIDGVPEVVADNFEALTIAIYWALKDHIKLKTPGSVIIP